MKTTYSVLLCLILMVSVQAWANDEVTETTSGAEGEQKVKPAEFVVSYLHMNRRCATCKKLEEYAREAVAAGFADQLRDGSLVWQIANFEEEPNKHLAAEYGLYTQALVITQIQDGNVVRWKNLKEIWPLVNNRNGFFSYVQSQINAFMKPSEKTSLKSK